METLRARARPSHRRRPARSLTPQRALHRCERSPKLDSKIAKRASKSCYNSVRPPTRGLTGSYFNDNANRVFDESPTVVRTDPMVNFNWGWGSPAPGVSADNFLVRWTGYVEVPKSGTYWFGRTSDDGMRIWVNGALVVDAWSDQAVTAAPQYGGAIDLPEGRASITVEYYEAGVLASAQLWVRSPVGEFVVPESWLSSDVAGLPDGWSLSADVDGELAYVGAQIGQRRAVIFDATGAGHPFTWNGSGWVPPPGENAVLTKDAATGLLVLHGEDGNTYSFRADGALDSVRSALDDRGPAAPVYRWSGSPSRLETITDPVSGRAIVLTYGGGACPAESNAPAGMLCKVSYGAFGLGETSLYYSGGHLARIVDPGAEQVDFGYDDAGRLTQVRDALTNDLIAAGTFSDPAADTHKTLIAYGPATAKATSVTGPIPDGAAGSPRPQHRYEYTSTTTRVRVGGVDEPNGYSREVTLSPTGRLASDRDGAGNVTRYEWDPADRPLKTTDATGLVTTTVYDRQNRPTDTYGPAPAGEFGADRRSTTAPHARTAYDGGLKGLAAAYWDNRFLAGAPKAHGLGVGDASGALNVNWREGPPPGLASADQWSARFTGDIDLPTTGTYQFSFIHDEGVRLFIDDQLVVDNWYCCNGPGANFSGSAGRHRIRVDFYDHDFAAYLHLFWRPPGASTDEVVPGDRLFPRYDLVTSSTDADNHTTEFRYQDPARGLATATVVDPAGLALASNTEYEPAGQGFARRTARSLPKGAATRVSYDYYGPTETADNPCTAALDPAEQGGALKAVNEADPDGDSPAAQRIVRELRYDAAGRVVAKRVVGDAAWSCTTYDPRGRITSGTDAAGAATTMDYSAPDTVRAAFPDSSGEARTTAATVDWLGRARTYTDEHGATTRTSYDAASRPVATHRRFSGQPETALTTVGYDTAGRPSSVTDHLSAVGRTASFGYDPAGRLRTTARPNGVTTTATYDPNRGTLATISHAKADVEVSRWDYQRTPAGRVRTESGAGRTRSFGYDAAQRLSTTTEASSTGTVTRSYAWDANTNRCSTAVTGCDDKWVYDNADRLVSSPLAGDYRYDRHGNLVSGKPKAVGHLPFTIAYDANDHAVETNDGTTKVAETLSPSGRVLRRVVSPLATGVASEDSVFGYDGSGDSPAYTRPSATPAPLTTYLQGPGGLLVTDVAGVASYPLANEHGDIVGTTDVAGVFTPTPPTDEFGVGEPPPSRLGWLGGHQRYSTGGDLRLIRMGVRLYDPALGRFLQVDPIEGGCANDYAYVYGDPINQFDLDGRVAQCGGLKFGSFSRFSMKRVQPRAAGMVSYEVRFRIDGMRANHVFFKIYDDATGKLVRGGHNDSRARANRPRNQRPHIAHSVITVAPGTVLRMSGEASWQTSWADRWLRFFPTKDYLVGRCVA